MTTSHVTKVLLKRGNTQQNNSYTGVYGELSIDMEANNLRIHDGVVPGGNLVGSGNLTINTGTGYSNSNVKSYLTQFDGDVIPSANVTYSLGSITHQWKDLFVSNNTIYINGVPLSLGSDNNTLSINGQPILSNASISNFTTTGNVTANAFITSDGINLYDLISSSIGADTGRFIFSSNTVPGELLTISSSNDMWIQGGPKTREDTYPDMYLFLHGTDGNGTGGAEIDIKNDGLTLWSKYGTGGDPKVKWTFDQTGKLTLPDNTNIYNDGGALRVDSTDKIQLSVYTGFVAQTLTLDTNGTVTMPGNTDVLGNLTVTGDTSAGNLTVTGDTTLGNTTIHGTFVLNGNTQYVVSENTVYTDNMLEIHAPEGGVGDVWTINDGKDIGIRMHYYNAPNDRNAALFMDNGDWRLKWVANAVEVGGQILHSDFGDIQAANFYGNIATASQTAITSVGTLIGLTVTDTITGNISGNAGTATVLRTARNINGVSFNGSANITITANAATLTGVTLNSTVLASSLTSVGTLGNLTVTGNISAGNVSATNLTGTIRTASQTAITAVGTLGNLTVSGNVALQGLTQLQQLDIPYTAKTAATGTVTHDCSVGQIFYHTSISGNFTPNFINLGLVSGFITEIKLFLLQTSTARTVTAMQIAGSAKTINWYNAVNPTYSTNAVDIITFTILLVGTTYTVFGKVEKYDSIAAGGGGGGGG